METLSVEEYLSRKTGQYTFDLDWDFGFILGAFEDNGETDGNTIVINSDEPDSLGEVCEKVIENKVKVKSDSVEFTNAGLSRWLDDNELMDIIDDVPEDCKMGFLDSYPVVGFESPEEGDEEQEENEKIIRRSRQARRQENSVPWEEAQEESVEEDTADDTTVEEPEYEPVDDFLEEGEDVTVEEDVQEEITEEDDIVTEEEHYQICPFCGKKNDEGICNSCLISSVRSCGTLRDYESSYRKNTDTTMVNPVEVKDRLKPDIDLDKIIEAKDLKSDGSGKYE